jgi:hypothetical protein
MFLVFEISQSFLINSGKAIEKYDTEAHFFNWYANAKVQTITTFQNIRPSSMSINEFES